MKIAIISDIHEDVQSLKQAIDEINKLECSEIVCMGDIVGFQPEFYPYLDTRNAEECLSIIRESCSTVLVGNHDLFPAKRIPGISGRFDFPGNWYELKAEERIKLSKGKIWQYDNLDMEAHLSENDLGYISSLPEFAVIETDGLKILFSHFLYPDVTGVSIYHAKRAKERKQHFDFMESNNCRIGFSGHAHIEGCVIVTKKRLKYKDFGSYRLDDKTQFVVSPCIAGGSRRNGFLVFDTETFMLDVIPLRK